MQFKRFNFNQIGVPLTFNFFLIPKGKSRSFSLSNYSFETQNQSECYLALAFERSYGKRLCSWLEQNRLVTKASLPFENTVSPRLLRSPRHRTRLHVLNSFHWISLLTNFRPSIFNKLKKNLLFSMNFTKIILFLYLKAPYIMSHTLRYSIFTMTSIIFLYVILYFCACHICMSCIIFVCHTFVWLFFYNH